MSVFEAPPIRPGDLAPDFNLPWIERDGRVTLSEFRGRQPVLFALVRGLWCPFCRRALASLGNARQQLDRLGVATFGIVATAPDNARLYLRYRPSRVPLAADPEMSTHASYGLPRPAVTPELMAAVDSIQTDARGELPEPVPFSQAGELLDRLDAYQQTATDLAEMERGMTQLTGHFLVDRDGIVRWTDIECAQDGLAGLGCFPDSEEVLAVASAL